MFSGLLKLTGACIGLNYAYKNYLDGSKGPLETVTKVVQDVFRAPESLFEQAKQHFNNTKVCHDAMGAAKASNLERAWYSPMRALSTVHNSIGDLACKTHDLYGVVYLGASLGVAYGIGKVGYKAVNYAAPVVKQLVAKLASAVRSKAPEPQEPVKAAFADQIKEFAEVFTKLNHKIPSMVSTVFLKGDMPVVELETDLSQKKLLKILEDEGIKIKSFEMTPDGKCKQIHLETTSQLDLCFVL